MEYNKEEAFRAKEIAEKRFSKKDFTGAKKYAVKAKNLYPELEGISQMLATFDVYVASTVQIGGEIDFYSVLGLNHLVDEDAVKKQYKKLALILHPDKNKTVGADGAFKLVSEAWAILSDSNKRSSYDLKRNKRTSVAVSQPSYYPPQTHGFNGFSNSSKPVNSHNQPKSNTFWTICTSCKVQYEYYRKYLNNKLSCKNCRKTFVAVETGTPVNGSNPFCSWSVSPEYGHGHVSQVTLVPAHMSGTGVPGFHSGVTTQYQNISLQRSPVLGTFAGVVGSHGSVSRSAGVVHQANEKGKGMGERVKIETKRKDRTVTMNDSNCNTASGYTKPPVSKADRPEKKRKVDGEHLSRNVHVEIQPKTSNTGVKMVNGDGKAGATAKACGSGSNDPIRRFSMAPAFDARQLLIQKAQTEIRKKLEEMKLAAAKELEEMKLAAAAAAEENAKVNHEEKLLTRVEVGISVDQPEHKEPGSVSINVPDSDFHDFDLGRSEDSFKPKQIWAVYDEEDGMPRLYCLIRKVLSLSPFKILISYLHSKSNCEFGLGDLVGSGYTKSCGYFRAGKLDTIDSVNIFSHVICGGKTLRGGGIQVFPKKGDIWAVYRNWSADVKNGTPPGVKHQFEMVEVLDDYSENAGVYVNSLSKVDGFRTVYQRKLDQNAIRWIPRGEMLRFSHQVPSWSIRGEANLPDGCCDLDPAATPEELLEGVTDTRTETPPEELLEAITETRTDNKLDQFSEQ